MKESMKFIIGYRCLVYQAAFDYSLAYRNHRVGKVYSTAIFAMMTIHYVQCIGNLYILR